MFTVLLMIGWFWSEIWRAADIYWSRKPGRHAAVGRHRLGLVAAEVAYVVRRVEGAPSHRRRQGGVTMPEWRAA